MSAFLYRLALRICRRAWFVVLGWIAVAGVLGILFATVGGTLTNKFEIPGTEAQQGLDTLANQFPQMAGVQGQILFTVPPGHDIHKYRAQINACMDQARESVGDVKQVVSPFDTMVGPETVSNDDTAALGTVLVDTELGKIKQTTRQAFLELPQKCAQDGMQVNVGGELISMQEIPLSWTEATGVVAALVVLALTFMSLIAAGLPIINALVSVGISMLVLLLAARFVAISTTTPTLAIMLGLAVGIDYSLFIVSRHRDQLAHGMEVDDSIPKALATSGSAVVFAGFTVIIALFGLSVANIPFLSVMGIAAAVAIAFSVITSLTLLPAIMKLLGEKLRPRHRRGPRASQPTLALRWVRATTKYPLVTLLICVVCIGVLIIPAKDLTLAMPDNGVEPVGTQARDTYDLVAKKFGPGANSPLMLTADILTTTDPIGTLKKLEQDVLRVPGVSSIQLATPNTFASLGVIVVIPTTAGSDPQTAQTVRNLRSHAKEWEEKYGIYDVVVTGASAAAIDVSSRLTWALIPFSLVVMGLSLVLLFLVFRSFWVPITATLGFMLSIGAALGVATAVSTWGWGASWLGVKSVGPIICFGPIVSLGVLFGLAMDYQVFIVSSIREAYANNPIDAKAAIHTGFTHSSKVVTAAGLIMILVFAAFVPSGSFYIQPIALTLAVGVAVDAFVVRMTMIPAAMTLLGKRVWALPKAVDRWLPMLDIEGQAVERQVEHLQWVEEHGECLIRAEDVRFGEPPLPRFGPVNLVFHKGKILRIGGGPQAFLGFCAAVSGRLALQSGKLIVDGHVIPDEASAVRTRVAWLSNTDRLQKQINRLARPQSRIVLIMWGLGQQEFMRAEKPLEVLLRSGKSLVIPAEMDLPELLEQFELERLQINHITEKVVPQPYTAPMRLAGDLNEL